MQNRNRNKKYKNKSHREHNFFLKIYIYIYIYIWFGLRPTSMVGIKEKVSLRKQGECKGITKTLTNKLQIHPKRLFTNKKS